MVSYGQFVCPGQSNHSKSEAKIKQIQQHSIHPLFRVVRNGDNLHRVYAQRGESLKANLSGVPNDTPTLSNATTITGRLHTASGAKCLAQRDGTVLTGVERLLQIMYLGLRRGKSARVAKRNQRGCQHIQLLQQRFTSLSSRAKGEIS